MLKFFKKVVKTIKRIADKKLNFVIFFVTSTCNSRCKSCFFWQNLNANNDLSLDQVEKTSENLGQFDTLLLSGGEPFLRPDLVQLVNLFVKNNSIKNLGIPTNTLLGEKIIVTVREILNNNKNLNLTINVSLDGLKEDHEYIRGVPGNFDTAMRLIFLLGELKKEGFKFNVVINSVICCRNYSSLLDLAAFIKKDFPQIVGMHVFEIIRGDAKDPLEKKLSESEVKAIFNKLFEFQSKNYLSILPIWESIIAKASLISKYNLQYKAYCHKAWPVRCNAGQTSAVIYPNGDLAYCELKESLANIKDNGFNPVAILQSFGDKIKSRIKKEKCDCTHICFVNEALWYSFFGIFVVLPFYYLRYMLTGKIV